jgi:mono/diheme cytochrome c family protein
VHRGREVAGGSERNYAQTHQLYEEMKMKRHIIAIALAALSASGTDAASAATTDTASIERGRYLTRIGGCNDCHTPGYNEVAGKLPETEWLMGSPVGFQGPWGTTYPANLRLTLDRMTEAQWLARARAEMRPPMPWFNLRDMTDDDLRAIYRYVKSLGPKGPPAPQYAAPGQQVATPYFVFVPQNLPQQAATR